ncbi:UMP kinase [Anaplasmataceae bacterium AB001_6]|nr:UMP kinase [Anaplasmataceae bacterium AB001_6]
MSSFMPRYRRVLLKVSGELLMGERDFGHDCSIIHQVAEDVKQVHDLGVQICLVIGGGNIHRGTSNKWGNIDRTTSDHMGMLATVINSLAIMDKLENIGVDCRVMSALSISSICETYIRRRADRHISKGRVVIFACGTGNPFFTTDTAAVLRSLEMNCDIIIKGSKIDGIYSDDPKKNKDARKFLSLTYDKVIREDLKFMDISAISLAKDNGMPISVLPLFEKGSFKKFIMNESEYSLVS